MKVRQALAYVLVPFALAGGLTYTAVKASKAPEAAEHARDTQVVLCVGIIDNTANPARTDARVLDICRKVGVTP